MQTLLMVKPDAIRRGLVGRILQRLEDKGLVIKHMQMINMDFIQVEEFYAEHRGKDFHQRNVMFVASGPQVAVIIEGPDAQSIVRQLVGDRSVPGTIRGDFCSIRRENLCHASDGPGSAKREIEFVKGIMGIESRTI